MTTTNPKRNKKRKLVEVEDIEDVDSDNTNSAKRARLTINNDNKECKEVGGNNKENANTDNTNTKDVEKENKTNDNDTDPEKKDIFNGKDPNSLSKKELKELCKKNNLLVGGNKSKLIARLNNPNQISAKAKGGQRLSVAKVHKMLQEQGVKNPESVSNCLKRGIQKGYVVINSDKGLDAILLSSSCLCCCTTHNVKIRDILNQNDYGGDYEDGGPNAEIQCGEDCCGLYVTGICENNPSFDSGKFHNHCTECPGFGKCIHDYREAHCSECGKHYFQGLSGFGCSNCERKNGGGYGGGFFSIW